jgi:hypothetical protein
VEPRVLRPERSYADRIELCGLLAARHPYPEGWADQRAGILLQTKWQDRSGRAIAGADGRLDSWWPIANWTLTVWQLETLQARGELSEVMLAERPLPLPDDVAAAIGDYYDAIDAAHTTAPGERHRRGFELQRRLWTFHLRAIERGLAHAAPHLSALPSEEARFAESWGHCMVGLLAAVNFPTEFDAVRGMQRMLPSRLLQPGDWDGAGDLAEAQRKTMIAMRALHDAEREHGRPLEQRLAAASTTPEGARAAAGHLWETLAFGGAGAAEMLEARLATTVPSK